MGVTEIGDANDADGSTKENSVHQMHSRNLTIFWTTISGRTMAIKITFTSGFGWINCLLHNEQQQDYFCWIIFAGKPISNAEYGTDRKGICQILARVAVAEPGSHIISSHNLQIRGSN